MDEALGYIRMQSQTLRETLRETLSTLQKTEYQGNPQIIYFQKMQQNTRQAAKFSRIITKMDVNMNCEARSRY